MEPELRRSLWHISNFIKPGYQVLLMISTSILLLSLSYVRMNMFRNIDRSPGIVKVEGAVSVNRKLITTGLNLRNFLKFDLFENNFVADTYLWFEYDAEHINQKDIEDFSFGKAEIISKSKPYITTNGNRTQVGYDVKIKFPSNLNYKFFPISSHRLYLTLNNLSLSSDTALFDVKPETFSVSKTLYINGWQYLDKGVVSGFKSLELNTQDVAQEKSFQGKTFQGKTFQRKTFQRKTFPRVIFAIDFIGTGFRNLLLILLPLLVIFFVGLFMLGIDPTKYYSSIVAGVSATITALLSYRFVIETLSPDSSYFMLSDHLFDLILVLNFMIFLVGTVFLNRLEKYRGLLIVLFHLILISGWIYFLFIWAI